MQFAVLIVLIIVGITISLIKTKNLNERKKEEKRREEEKLKPRTGAPSRNSESKPNASARKNDPFSDYRVDPFAENTKYSGSLSAAQLNEWLLDFAAAEKAGASRPEKGEFEPLFARYLFETGFSYRLIRKIRGYAPQNRLTYARPEIKKRRTAVDCGISNDLIKLPEQEPKTSPINIVVRQRAITVPLEKKEIKSVRALYESFYKGKD